MVSYRSPPHTFITPPPRHHPAPHYAQSAVQLVAVGGIELLLAVMDKHWSAPKLLSAVCEVLQGACNHHRTATSTTVLDARVDAVVIRAMTTYPEHRRLQEQGSAVIAHLCTHSHRHRSRIIRAGGVQFVLQTMAAHPTSCMVQEMGLRTLHCCLLNRSSVRWSCRKDVEPEDVDLDVAQQQQQQEQCESAVAGIASTAQESGTHQRLDSAHIAGVILCILQLHSSHGPILQYGMALLEHQLDILQRRGDTAVLSNLIHHAGVVEGMLKPVRDKSGNKYIDGDAMYISYCHSLGILAGVERVETFNRVQAGDGMWLIVFQLDP